MSDTLLREVHEAWWRMTEARTYKVELGRTVAMRIRQEQEMPWEVVQVYKIQEQRYHDLRDRFFALKQDYTTATGLPCPQMGFGAEHGYE